VGDYFYVILDHNTASEEVVKCESRASGTFTVLTGGRGASGTQDTAHQAGASVIHGWVAQEADDMNAGLVAHDAKLLLPVRRRTYARSVASVGDGNLGVVVDSST
jgi:hypothetical protein